jgi:hypothetical protein
MILRQLALPLSLCLLVGCGQSGASVVPVTSAAAASHARGAIVPPTPVDASDQGGDFSRSRMPAVMHPAIVRPAMTSAPYIVPPTPVDGFSKSKCAKKSSHLMKKSLKCRLR